MKSAFAFVFLASVIAAGQTNLSTMPKLGSVDERFQSYNVEMVEVIGGRFWKPYASKGTGPVAAPAAATPGGMDPSLYEQRTPIDLTDPRLRKLAGALGPAYLRVSGTWANTVFFQDTDAPAPGVAPEGFGGVLTRAEWKRVVDFSKAVDGRIVTSFATGAGVRDASGTWTAGEAQKWVDATKAMGGTIAAAEFMNEPTFAVMGGVPKGYDGAAYGRDYAVFQPFFRKALPGSLLLGPGSVGEGIDLAPMKLLPSKDLLTGMGPNAVDVFSFHFYGGVSERCSSAMGGNGGTTPGAALSEEWLGRTGTVEAFYAGLRDQYAPGKPMWLTETGQTACGGDRWAATFLDTFRYIDQLGQMARRGVKVVMHNTLAASDYGLIDEKTLMPRPSYWAALLWHKTMGTTVLDAGAVPGLRVYAQCMKGQAGGVTLVALNVSRTESGTLAIPEKGMRYTLTAPELTGSAVELNGTRLAVSSSGDLPGLVGVAVGKGTLTVPAGSITFLTFAGAGNGACR